MRKSIRNLVLSLSALIGAACGGLPEISDAFIIGITPDPSFNDPMSDGYGRVRFTVLPRDAEGEAVIDAEVELAVGVVEPAGISVEPLDRSETAPRPEAEVAAALLFDASGSMRTTDPGRLRVRAGQAFIDVLQSGDRVAVLDFPGFDASLGFGSTRLIQGFTTDLATARAAVESIGAGGGTPMYTAALETIEYFQANVPSQDAVRGLLLLGDGQPSAGGSQEEVCMAAQAAGLPINTVGFGPAADQSPRADGNAVRVLRDLATCSSGAYSGVVDAEGLEGAFINFARATRSGSSTLVVRFVPVPPPATTVMGTVAVASPGQGDPVEVEFSFVTPSD